MEHPATRLLKYRLERCVNSITFQMSQNCNLRCSYCPYSDKGIYDNRTHIAKNMSWDTVQKGLEFLFQSSAEASELSISFYGESP